MAPPRLAPMLASASPVPGGDGWAAEVKWDGMRAIATVTEGRLRLVSRPGKVATDWFPELAELSAALQGRDAVLDGEVIVCGKDGRPAFHLLRRRLGHGRGGPPATLMVFDLLWLDGEAVYRLPWAERRERLEGLGLDGDRRWHVPPAYPGDDLGPVATATRDLGLEGVVLKRTASAYQPGRRSPDWVKVKHTKVDELVVGAVLPAGGSRKLSGLVVGWPREDGRLDYAGVVELGFRAGERAAVYQTLDRCRSDVCPFTRSPALGHLEWVEPALTVEVRSLASETGRWLREPVLSRLVGVRA